MPLTLKEKPKNDAVFFLGQEEYGEQLLDSFPGINQIVRQYDLALVDVPLPHPPYHSSTVPYPTSSLETLFLLKGVFKNIMKQDSIILAWASGKTMPQILQLIQGWEYTFLTVLLVWVKTDSSARPKLGLGYWTRSNCEFLLMAKRGNHSHLRNTNRNVSQLFYEL